MRCWRQGVQYIFLEAIAMGPLTCIKKSAEFSLSGFLNCYGFIEGRIAVLTLAQHSKYALWPGVRLCQHCG